MPLYSIVIALLFAVCFLPYLILALRRRAFSMVLFTLSILIFLLYGAFFNAFPASYKHYLWIGNLHLGPFVFRPGLKPDVTWISMLLVPVSYAVFCREETQKKRFSNDFRQKRFK